MAYATTGNDFIVGTEFNDKLNGLSGDDTLIGLGGNDNLMLISFSSAILNNFWALGKIVLNLSLELVC